MLISSSALYTSGLSGWKTKNLSQMTNGGKNWCNSSTLLLMGLTEYDSRINKYEIGVLLTTCDSPTDAIIDSLNIDHVCRHSVTTSFVFGCCRAYSYHYVGFRPMSYLQFYRAILSRNFIVRQSCSIQLCTLHTAMLSHKQELTNQHSVHFRNKVAQNRELLYSEKVAWLLRSCVTCHVTLEILSHDNVAPQNGAIRLQVRHQSYTVATVSFHCWTKWC